MLLERVLLLEKDCEKQSALFAAQTHRCELQERTLQHQEQQLEEQERLIHQLEQHSQQQSQRLHELETQIQQQEQLLDQQEQVLDEQGQRLDQQEDVVQEHKALIDDLYAGGPEEDAEEEYDEPADAKQIPDGPHRVGSPRLEPVALPTKPTSPLSGGIAGSSSDRLGATKREIPGPSLLKPDGFGMPKPSSPQKKPGVFWDKVVELCEQERFLEAYKQVIAEPEESCLLRLMQHTGPIVERLDAESNSRLIRRLIHILSSPSREPAANCIDQIFSWLGQALDVAIHFTTSQVEDLATALQKASALHSPLAPPERVEAARLHQRVSALRRG